MKRLSLHGVARRVQLIARVTPVNAEAEVLRLAAAFGRGDACWPSWAYAPREDAALEAALRDAVVVARSWEEPLRTLALERAEEVRLELGMCAHVGRAGFGRFATERYGRSRSLGRLVETWLAEPKVEGEPCIVTDDALDPRSLLSQMRAAVGVRRAPFAGVHVVDGMQALAATGERAVYVARGRKLSERAARRVALHEVDGHVLPRVRAESAHPIFTLGTARGTDDQEGLALLYEERAGLLDGARRVELALRHLAATAMQDGADFPSTVRLLSTRRADLSVASAVRIATRAFRGSDGRASGLGRERVYLPALIRLRRHLDETPDDEALLASGQVAVAALSGLRLLAQVPGRHARPWPPPSTETVWQT